MVARFSSSPDRDRIFRALTRLCTRIELSPSKSDTVIELDARAGRFIIFSDQHKGAKDGADDFALAERNYVEALRYYDTQGFHFISLGDSEELWENTLQKVKQQNKISFDIERKFVARQAFTKVFGNHDLEWDINPLAANELRQIYGARIQIKESVLLMTRIGGHSLRIFCTHGHQGDVQSDGNYFSKFFVAAIWAPLQSYLMINPNTPANNNTLKSAHNNIMYDWSSRQKGLILITGHTHQPVFESLTRLERIQRDQSRADTYSDSVVSNVRPTYFNSGCCCYSDGDITGIEIFDGEIKLIKWHANNQHSERVVLENTALEQLARQLNL